MPTIKEMPEARLVPSKAKEVTAPVIPADEAFGNSIMSMRDEADATGSRLHNALVNCEATYNRELTRINAAYQAERTSLEDQIARHNRILNGCDAALEALRGEPAPIAAHANVVSISSAAE
jgi:hypothetical protein